MIRMVMLDLDGTLFGPGSVVSPVDVEEIRRVHSIGANVGIATGRMPFMFRQVTDALQGINLCLVCGNGSWVKVPGVDEPLVDEVIEYDTAVEILAAARSERKYHHAYTYDNLLVTDTNVQRPASASSSSSEIPTHDMASYVRDNGKTVRKITIMGANHELAGLRDLVLSVWSDKVNCWVSSPWSVEIVNSRCTKMIGMTKVLNAMNLTFTEVMAIGDGENDIDLISKVGLGVAMGNAVPSLKKVAKHVTATNRENGVAKALRLFIP